MAWFSLQEFKDKHLSADDLGRAEISEQAISDALQEAEDWVVSVCEGDIRQEVASGTTADLKVRRARFAQDKMAFRAMLLDGHFASRVRPGGIVEAQQDPNTGANNRYESFAKETQARRDELKTEALELLEPYLLTIEIQSTITISDSTLRWF